MADTAVPGAMAALKAALDASMALDVLSQGKAHRDLGFPNGGPRPPYHVWVPAEIDDWRRDYELSGDPPSVVEEAFRLRVYAVAFVATDGTFADHLDEMAALVDGVIGAVHTDPLMGGAVRLAIASSGSVGESFTQQFRVLNTVVWVDCQAAVCT